jgi:hypothetical protein
VKTEYHKIVICSIRTRPNRSARVPENHPPSDEISRVTAPMSPACPRDRPHSAITVGITKLYICTSNASSAQPPKQAPIVRRSLAFNSPNQASMAFLTNALASGNSHVPNAVLATASTLACYERGAIEGFVNPRRGP